MPLTLPDSKIIWAVRPINQTSNELLNALEEKDWYLPSLQQMVMENRKREWLSVRLLLKEMLEEEKQIAYTPAGKPYLADHSYHLSISHTKGYVAVALHKESSLGIDIEYISPRVKKIRSRFMSETEEQHLCKDKEEIHLLLHWSAKESLFKALEEENVDFQECLHIQPFQPVIGELSSFHACETRTEKKYDFIIHYLVREDYVLTFTSKVLCEPCLPNIHGYSKRYY